MRRGLSEGEKQGGAHNSTPARITAAGRASHACGLRAMAPFFPLGRYVAARKRRLF
jgi:hypothetical protein